MIFERARGAARPARWTLAWAARWTITSQGGERHCAETPALGGLRYGEIHQGRLEAVGPGIGVPIQADDLMAVGETVEGEIGADLPARSGDEEDASEGTSQLRRHPHAQPRFPLTWGPSSPPGPFPVGKGSLRFPPTCEQPSP